jgi:lipoprotein-anchoring transpeptidase ErfK/SrfK
MMTAFMQMRMAATVMAAVLATQATAQTAPQQAELKQQTATQQVAAPAHKRVIVVSLEDHKLALVEDGHVVKVYPVAVGKRSTPSPVGTFTIERRVMNPTYSHDGRVVAPGPNNPVGTRWMGLSVHGYGIHGTNAPGSIGKAASHGCIRMGRADLEELYAQVQVGDTVELIGQRDEETAELFGGAAQPAATTQLAKTEPAAATHAMQQPATTATTTAAAMQAAVVASAAAVAGAF